MKAAKDAGKSAEEAKAMGKAVSEFARTHTWCFLCMCTGTMFDLLLHACTWLSICIPGLRKDGLDRPGAVGRYDRAVAL